MNKTGVKSLNEAKMLKFRIRHIPRRRYEMNLKYAKEEVRAVHRMAAREHRMKISKSPILAFHYSVVHVSS